jgi:hypothetical protein
VKADTTWDLGPLNSEKKKTMKIQSYNDFNLSREKFGEIWLDVDEDTVSSTR